jgi:hypothetical protein
MFFYIPYLHTKQQIKEICINLYSWTGTVTVIMAYFMTSIDIEEYILIDCLNIYGSFSIGYTCYRSKVWSAMTCEIIWFIIAVVSFTRHILGYEVDDFH